MSDWCDRIYRADSRDMSFIPNESIHLVVTSPPYNVGISYNSHDDNMPHDDYMAMLADVWRECWRVLVPGGRLCINVSADGRNPYHALQSDFHVKMVALGWNSLGWVIWDKGEVLTTAWGSWCSPSAPSLRDQNEFLLFYQKGEGPLSLDGFGAPDITPKEFTAWTQSIWRFPPVTKRGNNPCPVPFPAELPKRCIKLLTAPGMTVLDPFCGGGTTPVAARTYGRHFVGVDKDMASCRYAAFALGCDAADMPGEVSAWQNPSSSG